MRLLLVLYIVWFSHAIMANVMIDRIVVIINDDVIMQSEFEHRLQTTKIKLRQQQISIPDNFQQQVLEKLIMDRLQLQLADQARIRADDNMINQTVQSIAQKNNISVKELVSILEKDGYNYDKFKEDIREEMTITELRRRQVAQRLYISDKEIDDFLSNETIQGNSNIEIKLLHILIDSNREDGLEVAEKILADLKSGADFSKLAQTYSDGQQAQNGGDLGWRKISDVPSLFTNQIPNMKKGDISDIIKSNNGLHIIKMADIKNDGLIMVEQTHVKHILIKPNTTKSNESIQKKLEQIIDRIDNGQDFNTLAKAHSEDTASAIDGGDLGWLTPGSVVPEFQTVIDNTPIGKLSQPFQSRFGWHVLKVLDRRSHDNTESVKRNRARAIIYNKKLDDALQDWIRLLRDEAYIEYRLDNV